MLGPSFDLVGWNEPFSRIWEPEILPGHLRNVIWMAFGDPERQRIWVNWEQRSRILLAEFRATAGQHAGDRRFGELVDRLSRTSGEFRSWWPACDVRRSIAGPLKVRTPNVGTIAFDVIELRVCSHPSLTLAVHAPARISDERKVASLGKNRR